ncbi:fungal-specific transcription factor domain-containing protein [Phaeosphaeria sp. MPI-PUGE-AT-0046c]|nr:fungal-specific transcription factor domain-containing protein [Phaeosphaeria sp. MPI-PUGE-AT-0046c]
MWKDQEGRIVTKKPVLLASAIISPCPAPIPDQNTLLASIDFLPFSGQQEGAPISPPISNNSVSQSWDDHDSGSGIDYSSATIDPNSLSSSRSLPKGQINTNVAAIVDDAPFDDMFTPDTAISFNNPFTTMSNYNWLFDMDLSKAEDVQESSMPHTFSSFPFSNTIPSQSNQTYDLQLDHKMGEGSMPTVGRLGSLDMQWPDSPQHQSTPAVLITPLSHTEQQRPVASCSSPQEHSVVAGSAMSKRSSKPQHESFSDIERPMSMLYPFRSLPIIDEVARAQVLDLIDITQPTAPDGSIVMRDHPLLALACLQTYCDLFFTRFNTAYPLIHMSTFDPSEADTLFLISVLLLGATYGDKDAHQLAVCIHDNIRPQIFANAGFSAKPNLWILQTILLVECFGKSRAGQKQHEMSHLFHGLLINLIRRSDCQTVRSPALEDRTDDLEEDWRTWCDAEQKKRLAFLCFMWDTQNAVLFCQSLCMSAFELRSNLPCNQSLWEAESAETWHQLRQSQPPTPLFLSSLKMYLHPNAATAPQNLNALSRSLILHGLMSVAWDMQRRDQTSLGVIDINPLGNWQARLANSYIAWHKDYQNFCKQYISRLPSRDHFIAKEFQVLRAATLSLYHSAHILLYTPFLDLQIYAGARHILGRPIARHDYARSQRGVKRWIAENPQHVSKAVWHAAFLVSDGVNILDSEWGSSEVGGSRLWHHPWAVYLGTLVIWSVWYARPAATVGEHIPPFLQDDEDEIIWDPNAEMKGLLDGITQSDEEKALETPGMKGAMGMRGTNGMAAVVSRCLSKVRWAVVHDGMMVLRGLVQWRLVGGGGAGGM